VVLLLSGGGTGMVVVLEIVLSLYHKVDVGERVVCSGVQVVVLLLDGLYNGE
jgi:hypothetical protein